MSEYTEQARAFAEKHGITMTTVYLGHYPHFDNRITANYRITLQREGFKPFSFDFSTAINDSWGYRDHGPKVISGLPPRIDMKKFFAEYLKKPVTEYRGMSIIQRKTPPTLYDVLACLTKYNPGTFDDFCSEYGYDTDSRSAEKTHRAVLDEWYEVSRFFKGCLDELGEIS